MSNARKLSELGKHGEDGVVLNVSDLTELSTSDIDTFDEGAKVHVTGYHVGSADGGGEFIKVASATHDGVVNFDPSRIADIGTEAYYTDDATTPACWQRVDYDELWVTMAGAVNSTGYGDLNKIAFQAIIDHAESMTISPQGGPIVNIPSGVWPIASSGDDYCIILKECHLHGSGSFGCILEWNGDADGTLILDKPRYHKSIQGFRCNSSDDGVNNPSCWIDATYDWDNDIGGDLYGVMDYGDWFEDLFFTNTSSTVDSAHMKFATVTNLYMNKLRFQAAPHLIIFTQGAGASVNRVCSLREWTVDFGSLDDTVDSLFKVQLNGSNAQFCLELNECRIESSGIEMTGTKSIVEVVDPFSPDDLKSDPFALTLKNSSIQIDGTGNSLVYQNTTQTSVTSNITIENSRLSGIVSIHGGTWNPFFITPEPEDFTRRIIYWATGRTSSDGTIQIGGWSFSGDSIKSYYGSEVISGQGNPEGSVTANKGSIFMRSDGGVGFTIYYKTTDDSNTGWVNSTISTTNVTGGSGSAGSGSQYVELSIAGTTYKLLHDGTV